MGCECELSGWIDSASLFVISAGFLIGAGFSASMIFFIRFDTAVSHALLLGLSFAMVTLLMLPTVYFGARYLRVKRAVEYAYTATDRSTYLIVAGGFVIGFFFSLAIVYLFGVQTDSTNSFGLGIFFALLTVFLVPGSFLMGKYYQIRQDYAGSVAMSEM